MAGKKPAKKNVSNSPVATLKVEQPGKPILYVGLKGKSFICPKCSRELQRGIVYEHNNEKFCSRNCIA
jgi:hypothetical protein